MLTAFVVYDLSEILFFIQGFVTFERKSRPPVSAVHSGSGLLWAPGTLRSWCFSLRDVWRVLMALRAGELRKEQRASFRYIPAACALPIVLLCSILPWGLLTFDLTDQLGCRLLVCYWLYPLTKQAGNWQLPNNPMRGWPTACSAYRLLVDGGQQAAQIRNVACFLLFLANSFLPNETAMFETWKLGENCNLEHQSRLTTLMLVVQ